MKQRFKNNHQNIGYQTWIKIPFELAEKVASQRAKGNRDLAFKSGYIGWSGKQFPKNSLLYAIFVAGKEYKKVNKIK